MKSMSKKVPPVQTWQVRSSRRPPSSRTAPPLYFTSMRYSFPLHSSGLSNSTYRSAGASVFGPHQDRETLGNDRPSLPFRCDCWDCERVVVISAELVVESGAASLLFSSLSAEIIPISNNPIRQVAIHFVLLDQSGFSHASAIPTGGRKSPATTTTHVFSDHVFQPPVCCVSFVISFARSRS